ncbi:MAG: panthothenate synthetase [Edaphobacter sp.]
MRMMMIVSFPVETFNAAVKDGSTQAKIKKIMDQVKPEAAYFTALNGKRTAVLIVDLADPSKIPGLAEPWFLTFNASVDLYPVMLPQDLAAGGLDGLGKQWG